MSEFPPSELPSQAEEPTVLVLVLDSPTATQDIAESLRTAFPHVRISRAGHRGTFLDALACASWSLVVVSFDIEGYAGADALHDALQHTAAPVVALGDAPRPAQVVSALRQGAADFLSRREVQGLGAACSALLAAASAKPVAPPAPAVPAVRLAQSTRWLMDQHAVVLCDQDWVVTECSQGVAAVLGYEPRDLVGQPLEVLFAGIPDALAMSLRLRAPRDDAAFRDSGWMLRRDGLRMWADIACVSEPTAGGLAHRHCLTVRDATLQYRASHHVRHQAQSAASATLARNLFLGSVAHELRAALAPISTSAALLERPSLDAAVQGRLVGIVRRNAGAAARLVEDLLTFSTASENKLLMRFEEVDLHRLLLDCAEAVRPQAEAAGIALKLELDSTTAHARLQCDPGRIQQVVMNLLGNAVKFTPPGGAIGLYTSCTPDGFWLEVTDTGVGIDPAALPFIFDPFEQGGAEVTSGYGGFGLGLAICAAIARQHGGHVVATSAGLGQGASFRLCLPRTTVRTVAPSPQRPEPSSLHVLYVEDNADAADAMRYALTTFGWTMTHAATCARARELVHERGDAFDVMLADLGLPDGSGVELGNELSQYLPVVALTAYGAPLVMQGFTHQLMKPAEVSEVQRALLKAVSVYQGRRVH